MSVTLVDGRLRFCSDGSGYSDYGRRIDPDDYIPFPLWVPDSIENAMQPALPVPLGVPVIAPGGDDSRENEWPNSLTFLPENLVQSALRILVRSYIQGGSSSAALYMRHAVRVGRQFSLFLSLIHI